MQGRGEVPAPFPSCVDGHHSQFQPSFLLHAGCRQGAGPGALLGHVATVQGGRRAGSSKRPRDDVTSVTAVTLKISVASEGRLLCRDAIVPADVELGQAGDSALWRAASRFPARGAGCPQENSGRETRTLRAPGDSLPSQVAASQMSWQSQGRSLQAGVVALCFEAGLVSSWPIPRGPLCDFAELLQGPAAVSRQPGVGGH